MYKKINDKIKCEHVKRIKCCVNRSRYGHGHNNERRSEKR